jgi:glutamate-5-semialdehyde dehydrogenase
MEQLFKNAAAATRHFHKISSVVISNLLETLAALTLARTAEILEANTKDLARMDKANPKYDRLLLSAPRLEAIAQDLRKVAHLPSPLGNILAAKELANGLQLKKITVPLGVVGIVYEARPNVTFDVFALCLKSGNVCLLKGGSDAEHSNQAIVSLIKEVLQKFDLPTDIVTLLPPDRQATEALLNAVGYVDVIIPRGSQELINFVRQNAKVPVIETGAGIVHTYIDQSANLDSAKKIVFNAKTRKVSVCNALDCLLVHQALLPALPNLLEGFAQQKVEIFADPAAYQCLQNHYPPNLLLEAKPEHYGTEFLAYKMAIKTVKNTAEALLHIATFSSKHSEAIIAEDTQTIEQFFAEVDAAVVYANASTAFTDGGQFGMGAEIGISTQKLHARGPMALAEMTSYKWLVMGNGQIRS